MKKYLVLILSVIAAFTAAISLTACEAKVDKDGNVTITDGDKSNDNNNGGSDSSGSGSQGGSETGGETGGEQGGGNQDSKGDETPEHSHNFNKQIAEEKYLKSAATCTAKAVYYYSCECGEKGTQTFEYGELDEHHYNSAGECDGCGKVKASEGLRYVLNDDESGYICAGIGVCEDRNIVIPSEYKGKAVVAISDNAICNDSTITSLSFGDNIKSIGEGNLKGCGNVKKVVMGNGLSSIPFGLLEDCTILESLTIPFVGATLNGTKNTHFGYIFGAGTYSDNGKKIPPTLGCVTISGGDKIKHCAFSGCTSLTSVTIGNGVTSIGNNAFSDCTSLTSITIPDSVTNIDDWVFSNCVSLVNINVNANNRNYKSIKGDLYSKDGKRLIQYTIGKTDTAFTIPDGVTSIGSGAFSGCTSLTSVNIPDGVTSIGSSAFSGCASLTSVNIPDGVTSIGSSAFSGCASLTSVNIPDGVTSIGSGAFSGCTSLTSVNIPDGVTSIGSGAFSGCRSLTNVNIPDSVTSIGDWAFSDCTSLKRNEYDSAYYLGNEANKYIVLVKAKSTDITSCEINKNCKAIYNSAFSGCSSLTNVTIPVGVTSIGSNAFNFCMSFTNITIPVGVTSIGDSVFKDCKRLTSITIGNGVTSIGESAFEDCASLTNIIIPDSVTGIGSSAFRGCSGLQEITIPFVGNTAGKTESDTYQYPFGYIFGGYSYDGSVETTQYYYGSSTSSTTSTTYYIPSRLKKVTVTGGNILSGAFYNCSSLTSITIPDGVTSIGNDAFRGCSSLTSITIPDGVTSIGCEAFYNCASLTSITIPDGVTGIGSSAFRGCTSLTSITIPNSVTSIGGRIFHYCPMLYTLNFNGTMEQWNNLSKKVLEWNSPIKYIKCTDGEIYV